MTVVSFVIPVYRNSATLESTHEQLTSLFQNELRGYDYEIIFVDDGSDDDSINILRQLCQQDRKVKVFKLSRNFGQRSAILCGFDNCNGDMAVCMSADLQEPIEVIPRMVEDRDKGNEIVIGYRQQRDDAFVDRFFSNMFYSFIRLSNKRMPKGGFDFFLIDRRVLDNLQGIHYNNRFLQGDLLWLGFDVKYLPYHRKRRPDGKSQNTLSKRLKFFIDGILSSSYLPIRFISFMGITISLIGFIYTLIIIYNKLSSGTPYTGWASIMVINLVIGGLLMFMLGIIGEYIWRIHDEVKDLPNYVIDRVFRGDQDINQMHDERTKSSRKR